ncbi:uncharacterized protein LOC131245211 isoform X2 [Magnolia sinica]|uniref:uncharacterized protein LOC131245211 isoform X2 n=1 Tax=Magnolia sinica TaxID=86752 RepID=UPI0026589603|nr:uncharacterized protein LOC131245211 isoform X2 [Magnolia sinica]
MMDEKMVSVWREFASEERNDGVYPMYFGVSCAFAALHFIQNAEGPVVDGGRWSAVVDLMLQGSAQLLGLLVWKAQQGESMEGRAELLNKLKKAESEVVELKKRRSEDAKANEKVVGIFATQEQSWIGERKRLRQQIQALLHNSQILEKRREETISNLNQRVEKEENLIRSKDNALEEEEKKRGELEEKLRMAEAAAEELRETVKKESQEHSSELWRHKTAFIELVSNQRQLEAEMSRALQQVEVMKQELDAVFEQKEESVRMVQKLSIEIIKLQKDSEQKDKILSALLRKSKLDTAEKQMLLKEVKISKARRKQAELETERWKSRYQSRHDRHLRSDLANRGSLRSEMLSEMKGLNLVEAGCSQNIRTELQPNYGGNSKTHAVDYLKSEDGNELACIMPKAMNNATGNCFHRYSPEGNGEIADAKQLEDWVRLETEKYISVLEQKHSVEIDAFIEQMRLKDEKLEAFRWQLLSMELESKRLQSHVEELDENLLQFREDNMKLEAMLLDKERELKSLIETFSRRPTSNYSTKPPAVVPETLWSEVKIIRRKQRGREQEQRAVWIDSTPPSDQSKDHAIVGIYGESVEDLERRENLIEDQPQDMSLAVHALEEEIVEEKEVGMDPGHLPGGCLGNDGQEEAEVVNELATGRNCLVRKDTQWKMDLHALGVSYRIKRLKQQLLLLEKLAAAQAVKKKTLKNNGIDASESCEKQKINEHGPQTKGFLLIMSLLNKQVKRYQSLEEKTNDICKRMHENDVEGSDRDSGNGRTREQKQTLECFLEETFQLQRYMVATGQKLVEIQSRISCGFGSVEGLNESAGFNMQQFSESVGTLFRETQRGLEVRIARIIGDLEGTLASQGILHLRK